MAPHPALAHTEHRPWMMPSPRWTWRQTWCDLLFAHWPLPADWLRPLVPESLEVDEFDGTSWVGIVPFRMTGVARRPLPDLPGISAFPEINVRLYVEHEGKRGVYFLSLDATNRLAVWAARRFFHLPYHHADIRVERAGDDISYLSSRPGKIGADRAEFRARYRPVSDAYESTPGTLEHFLTERYCLFAEHPAGRLIRTEVHHVPWPLQRAEATIERNDLLLSHGITVSDAPAELHFARRLDVVVWSPEHLAVS